MNRPKLTVEEALVYQTAHLAQWKLVLQPEVFEEVRARVMADNDTITDGYDICRGCAIDEIVQNLAARKYYEQIGDKP